MIWALLACEGEQPWPLFLTDVPAERVVTVGQPVEFSADARGFESIAWYTGVKVPSYRCRREHGLRSYTLSCQSLDT